MEWMKNPAQDLSEPIPHNPGRVFQGKDHGELVLYLFPAQQWWALCEQRPQG